MIESRLYCFLLTFSLFVYLIDEFKLKINKTISIMDEQKLHTYKFLPTKLLELNQENHESALCFCSIIYKNDEKQYSYNAILVHYYF